MHVTICQFAAKANIIIFHLKLLGISNIVCLTSFNLIVQIVSERLCQKRSTTILIRFVHYGQKSNFFSLKLKQSNAMQQIQTIWIMNHDRLISCTVFCSCIICHQQAAIWSAHSTPVDGHWHEFNLFIQSNDVNGCSIVIVLTAGQEFQIAKSTSSFVIEQR